MQKGEQCLILMPPLPPQPLGVLLTHRLFLTFITEGKYYSISQIENSED